MNGWQTEILDFWLSLEPRQWWRADAELDRAIRERFEPLWEEQRQALPESFLVGAREALAATILFDQFPRNMFRSHADQYSTDPLARAIARGALERSYDEEVPREHRFFFYMPFQHSEDRADQERSLLLFTALGDNNLLGHAKRHHDVIARFGRFPHRNPILGRAPRAGEEAGDVVP